MARRDGAAWVERRLASAPDPSLSFGDWPTGRQVELAARRGGTHVPIMQVSNGAGHHLPEFEFHSPDFHTPEDVVAYTRGKLEHKLEKFGRHVLGVIVHVRDVNGPKGGNGLVCHLEARLAHMEPVNVEEREHDLRAAIDRAIDRLTAVVGRHVDKAFHKTDGRAIARDHKLSD